MARSGGEDAASAPRVGRRRPTMRDVADAAGVSQQLVSLVFRDAAGPSEASRDKVRAAAADLGYVPNTAARVLRQARTYVLGVVFDLKQPWETDLVEALYPIARSQGYRLTLGAIMADRNGTQVFRELLENRVEAVFITTTTSDPSQIADLAAQVPVVQIGWDPSGSRVDAVRVANGQGTRVAVDHLVGLGHSRIICLGGGTHAGANERTEGYVAAMTQHGLGDEIEVVLTDDTDEAGAAAASEIIGRHTLPTAILAANDASALGLILRFQKCGVRVPEDLSVVGFDDSHIAAPQLLDLTTVRQEPAHLAREAVRTVMKRLESRVGEQLIAVIEPTLVVRGTTAPPKH